MVEQTHALEASFDSRFLDDYLGGNISNDPVTAIVELIANAWDAGATKVKIDWPEKEDDIFSIVDNGHGLTALEFSERWTRLSYNRFETQGNDVFIPEDNKILNKRTVYGRNGKGRFSAFCFGDNEYFVETKKDSSLVCYQVLKSTGNNPLLYKETELPNPSMLSHDKHGTAVYTKKTKHIGIPEDRIRSEIGIRFLTDPDFTVYVNEKPVIFNDINSEQVSTLSFKFREKVINIRVIHTTKSDKTTQQHGVAWHVNNRLVGKCGWEGMRNDNILDGRTSIAKKYTFIVQADAVVDHVKPDWTGFKNNDEMLEFYDLTKSTILGFITELSKEKRAETTKRLKDDNRQKLSVVSPIGVSRWNEFVENIQVECPTLNDEELDSVAKILANLEASTSQYSLIHKLSEYTPKDLDDLYDILRDWNVTSAKAVLDEIQTRLRLIEELRAKVHKKSTLEVQELQPLFSKGLWIFGPEFESIEYTSNQGMTKVLQDLFKIDITGSKNRPDFVVLPESSVGLYGCYDYDDEGCETGVRKVVIVELKKPGISLGENEKSQCWKYVKELYDKGAILPTAKVDCYLLGEMIEQGEAFERSERNEDVKIRPMVFDTILKRAETRLLNLHKKVELAPFLEDFNVTEFLGKNTVESFEQFNLDDVANG